MARPVKNRYSRTLALPRFLIIPRKIDHNLEGQTMPLSRCVLSVHTNRHYPPRYVSLLMTVMMMMVMILIALIFPGMCPDQTQQSNKVKSHYFSKHGVYQR